MTTQQQQATQERCLRSVFVGNIPYDATEEKLKDIFSEAGPVLSFKLVYDRESGKPKGYGFCEYRDQETALSAMRNLNSYELNGRNLRVDAASNDRFKEEIKNLQVSLSGSSFDTPHGQEVDPDQAPEQIAQVVSSLPPEQMFEIATQMKQCVLTNPNEARNMLLQNPQLAYALLQLLVAMRIVDVQTASSILYKPNPVPMPLTPNNMSQVPGIPPGQMPVMPGQPQQMPPMQMQMHPGPNPMYDEFNRPVGVPVPAPQPNFDQRNLDPRLRQNMGPEIYDPRLAQQQPQVAPVPQPAAAPLDPRLRGQPQIPPSQQTGAAIRGQSNVPAAAAAPIAGPGNLGARQPQPQFVGQMQQQSQFIPNQPPAPQPAVMPNLNTPGTLPGNAPVANQSEAEKAQLIMQVLSLSDQQINMLPVDQRQSIINLRQQFQQQQAQQAHE